jgi:hypothetical protein
VHGVSEPVVNRLAVITDKSKIPEARKVTENDQVHYVPLPLKFRARSANGTVIATVVLSHTSVD